MTDNEKRFVGYTVTIPLIVAVLLSVVFCVTLKKADFPFKEDPVYFADYHAQDIKQPSEFSGGLENSIRKSDILSCITENTLIGDISLGNSSYPVIYKGNEVNASGKFNIIGDILVGEAGTCFAQIYKNDSSMLKLLSAGDKITVTAFYSDYEYEVVETAVLSNQRALSHCGDGIGRALVLYTDNSVGAGIGDDYFVCVCKMTSGAKVTGG